MKYYATYSDYLKFSGGGMTEQEFNKYAPRVTRIIKTNIVEFPKDEAGKECLVIAAVEITDVLRKKDHHTVKTVSNDGYSETYMDFDWEKEIEQIFALYLDDSAGKVVFV